MIGRRVAFFVVVALIAPQAYGGSLKNSKTQEIAEANVQDIWDEAKKLLEKLTNLINSKINEAEKQINNLVNDVEVFAEDKIKEAAESIGEVIEKLLDDLGPIKQAAIDAGIDISECTAENEDALKNLPKQLIIDATSCITNKVTEAKNILTQTINHVESTYKQVENLAQQLDDCGTGFTSVICVTQVVGKLTLALTELPETIVKDVAQATEYVKTLKIDLIACATKQLEKAQTDGEKIFLTIVDCIKKKM